MSQIKCLVCKMVNPFVEHDYREHALFHHWDEKQIYRVSIGETIYEVNPMVGWSSFIVNIYEPDMPPKTNTRDFVF